MKAQKFHSNLSTGNTIVRLALLGGMVFGSIYVILRAFDALSHAL